MIARVAQALNRKDGDKGFTLVELLVVVIIIGILAAIAVPVYLNQRAKAAEATLKSDLRNAAMAVETGLDTAGGWAALRAQAGTTSHTFYVFDDTWHGVPAGRPMWNDISADGHINASPLTTMEIVNYRFNSGWWLKHGEDFCIQGTHRDSDRNKTWTDPEGVQSNRRALFWDVQLGGLKTIEDLARAYDAGLPLSCRGYAANYVTNGGTY